MESIVFAPGLEGPCYHNNHTELPLLATGRSYIAGSFREDVRTVCDVTCCEQLRRGMAWVYTRYVTDADLQTLEAAARDSHTGLWSDPSSIPPWDYRRGLGRDRALR